MTIVSEYAITTCSCLSKNETLLAYHGWPSIAQIKTIPNIYIQIILAVLPYGTPSSGLTAVGAIKKSHLVCVV